MIISKPLKVNESPWKRTQRLLCLAPVGRVPEFLHDAMLQTARAEGARRSQADVQESSRGISVFHSQG